MMNFRARWLRRPHVRPKNRPQARRRVILINGQRPGELIVAYDCGVQAAETVVIKKIGEDFFTGE